MLRHALRADLPAVVETWVDAFSADPFFRWIAPDDEAYRGFGHDWLSFIAALWRFRRVRKKSWLLPIVLMMALFGGLIVLTQGTAVAPFIYTVF